MTRQIPSDSNSLKDRGAWLAIAYMKATKGDLDIFLEHFVPQVLSKQEGAEIRLEMSLYCLSKGYEVIETCLKDQFTDLPQTRISQIATSIIDAALSTIKTLFPTKCNDISSLYSAYIKERDKFSLFWKRILERGITINRSSHDISVFDQTVLHGTALMLALDAISVSQEQIENDHDNFLGEIRKQ